MIKRISQYFGKLLFVLSIASLLPACRENTLISAKLSPANDTAGIHADTLNCITSTLFDNDVNTSLNISGLAVYHGIGSITDSFFGTTNGSAFFQVLPQTIGLPAFDTSYHIDSVYMVLPYGGFTYGDTTDQNLTQTYQVFALDDTLGFYTNYYAYSTKPVDMSYPLSEPVKVNLYHLKDSLYLAGANHTPGLAIKLKTDVIKQRLNNALAVSYAASSDKALVFMNTFKGLCVRPADPRIYTKAMPYFRLDGSGNYNEAGILVYYHKATGTDGSPFEFFYSQTSCAHFNNITRNYSRFPLNNIINSGTANNQYVALQNQPGASIDVKAYGLTTGIKKGVLINKATLQISVLSTGNTKFAAPDQIFPVGIGNGTYPIGIDAGKEYPVEDRKPITSLTPYSILDGTSHTISYGTTNITTYTVGVPREVMASIAAGNDTLHLRVHGTQLYYGAYQMLAAGGNYPDYRYKTKLIVVHSSLK